MRTKTFPSQIPVNPVMVKFLDMIGVLSKNWQYVKVLIWTELISSHLLSHHLRELCVEVSRRFMNSA